MQKPQASPKDQEAKLIAVLKSDAPRKAKADACRELARVGTQEAVAPLAALLCNEELSHMARYGLEPIPDPAVDTALRDALGKVKGRLLVGVIGSIGVRRDPKAVPPLVKRLGDPMPTSCRPRRGPWAGSARSTPRPPWKKPSRAPPEANRLAVCEGLFRCADVLRAQGQRKEAQAIYDQLRTARPGVCQDRRHACGGAAAAEAQR